MISINAAKQARARGLVTVSDLCQEFEISGTVARTRLRQAGIVTKNGCYAWEKDEEELQRVRTILLGDRIALIG
jgi:hypothetical protein